MDTKLNWLMGMILAIIITAAVLVGGCAPTQKKDSPFDRKAVFDALDKNHDGKIGKKEYYLIWKDKKKAEEYFERLDKDDNSFLKEDEFVVPWVVVPLKKRP